jgi:hypothetical protein
MRLDRLRGGEALAGGGGTLLLVALFLPWFGRDATFCIALAGFPCPGPVSLTPWEAFSVVDVLLLIAALSGIGVAVLTAANAKTDVPVTSAALAVPIGLLATILVAYRVLEPVGELHRKVGLFVGLLASAAIMYGCWCAIRDEGTGGAPPAPRRSALRRR